MSKTRISRSGYGFAAKQAGLTLIELIVVLIIVAVILMVAIGGISNAMGKSDVNQDQQGVAALVANTKTLRTNGSYGTSGTNLVPSLIALKGVPATVNTNGTTLTNTWGGAITIVSTGTGYTVTTSGIPQDACIEHSMKLSKSMLTTAINGGTAIAGGVTAAQATTDCSNAGNANSVAWTSQS